MAALQRARRRRGYSFDPGPVRSSPLRFRTNTAQAHDRARRPKWRRAAFLRPKAGAVFVRAAETGLERTSILALLHPDALDDHRLDRDIARLCLDPFDLVDHGHPIDHLAEDRVTVVAHLVIEEGVVRAGVDEELRGRTVHLARPGHDDRPALVLEAVGRLVLDRRPRRLLLH